MGMKVLHEDRVELAISEPVGIRAQTAVSTPAPLHASTGRDIHGRESDSLPWPKTFSSFPAMSVRRALR